MDNSKKVILDLCGGSGAWSKPYADAGYRVVLITLPKYDVRRVEMKKHALLFEKMDVHYYDDTCILLEDIYGILAAPPCQEFSLAKNGRPRDIESGLKTVEACERIIRHCMLHGNPKFWAMENPLGLLRKFLGRPKFTFRQWEFGDPGVKPTDIWGYFNEPRKSVTVMPGNITKRYKSGKVNTLACAAPKHPEYAHLNLDRAALRAITPAGFAQAFYKANR